MDTQMQNPPKEQAQMVAPKKGPRMIKVFALRDFRIEKLVKDKDGTILEDQSQLVKPGQIVEVTEAKARELIKPIHGAFAFSGERYIKDGDTKRHDLTIARLATKRDLVDRPADPLTPLSDPLDAAV